MKKKLMVLVFFTLMCIGIMPVKAEAAVKNKKDTYNILSALSNSKAIDISGAKTANGTNVQIWDLTDELQQQFTITRVSGSYYKIMDVNSKKVLDVVGGIKKSGVNVQLYAYNGTKAQLWCFENAGNGYYYIKNKLGYYLDVSGARTTNGTNVQVYSRNKSNAQKFKLKSTAPYTLVKEGNYNFVSAIGNKVVDVNGGGTGNGTNVHLWTKNGTSAQHFRIKNVGQGYYAIEHVFSGKVLDVSGGVKKSGVNVQIWEYDGTDAQKWRFYKTGNYYYIKNKLGYYLDVAGGSSNDGTNIWVYSGNGTASQKFKLCKSVLIVVNTEIKLKHYMNRSLKQPYSGPCCAYAYGIGLSIVMKRDVDPMQFYINGLCHYKWGRVGNYTSFNASTVYNALKNGKPTMIHYTYPGSQHWVLIMGVRNGADPSNLKYGDFYCIDSATGKEVLLTSAWEFTSGTVKGMKVFN